MPNSYLHDRNDFRELIDTVALAQRINDPALVEKDYWIMHVLWGLKELGLTFALKGGTSLSKGFAVIDRFSEDIDIWIAPFDDIPVLVGPNQNKQAQVQSRRDFFERLRAKVTIPGIVSVERDTTYDDEKLRNAGLRLLYDSPYGSIEGLKDGVLLEVGFDTISPNVPRDISSWALDFARDKGLDVADNRALAIRCYRPEYTFVEKLQTVAKKFRQFQESASLPRNFLRHYYDIYQLLNVPEVQAFIGTPEYVRHKQVRFRSENQNLLETDAFSLQNEATRKLFESEYQKTAALYYRGQVPLAGIVKRIAADLRRL
jgi:predicted nucleotidyltransferase component of viral defense system